MFSIGEISARTGVKVPTIRYYEQMGLINAAERSSGNQRRYTRHELERLSFIRHARDLGLSLEAIRELVELSQTPDMPCDDAHHIAASHLKAVKERIALLRKLESELTRITRSCSGETVGECHVIQALADHGLCDHDHH